MRKHNSKHNKTDDVFYKLTLNIEETDEKETKEIINELNKLSKDDLKIVEKETFCLDNNEK